MSPTPKRQPMVKCPHCGALNDPARGSRYCFSCGLPISQAVTPFSFPDTGQPVRTVSRDGEPWFVGKDACDVIGISKYRDALAQLDDDERASAAVDTPGGTQTMTIVNEAGLYALMMISRSPLVKPFRRWVTHDVLPAIRKTGSYGIDQARDLTRRDLAQMVIIEADRADQAEQRAERAEGTVREIEGANGLTIRMFHKKYFSDVREREFFEHLYAKGYLIDQRGKGKPRHDGTVRDGAEHRHPSFKGKPYLYLHFTGVHGDKRREGTRVRPGQPELDFKAALVRDGLTANGNDDGFLFGIEGGA